MPVRQPRLPSSVGKRAARHGAQPRASFPRSICQPTQRLTLRTPGSGPGTIGRPQIHGGLPFGHAGHAPVVPTSRFGFGGQTAPVRADHRRPPRPALLAVRQAGPQKSTLRNMGRRGPTHQRHEPHGGGYSRHPNGSTSVSNCAVPGCGKAEFIAPQTTPLNSTCLPTVQRQQI